LKYEAYSGVESISMVSFEPPGVSVRVWFRPQDTPDLLAGASMVVENVSFSVGVLYS